jgi:integrase/recombinase XerD
MSHAESFLAHCRIEKNLSGKTIRAYRTDLEQFSGYLLAKFSNSLAENVHREMIRGWLTDITGSLKPKSIKRKVATLKVFFGHLEFEDVITVSPFRKLRIKIKTPMVLPSVLTLEEMGRILNSAHTLLRKVPDQRSFGYKVYLLEVAVLETLFATGVRVSEMCQLRLQQVDLEKGRIVVRGKGDKERMIHIGYPPTLVLLRQYSNVRSAKATHEYFFTNRNGNALQPQSVRRMVTKYCKLAKIQKPVTPHTFRHTFATLLMEEGVDIKYIQQFLGHSSITTTQIYTHVSKRKQEEILVEMHPRGRICR